MASTTSRAGAAAGVAAGLALLIGLGSPAAAEVVLATQDGLELALDDATGRVTRVTVDGADVTDRVAPGGLFVRDRARLLEVPPAAVELLPNPSLESDLDGDQVPDGWRFVDAWLNGATFRYGADAFDGRRSVTLERRAGGALVAYDIAVQPATRYLLQAQVKGTASATVYVIWKTAVGEFLLYEAGHYRPADPQWGPVHVMLTAPFAARLADIYVIATSDGDLTVDLVRMNAAPPTAMAPLSAAVTPTAAGARQAGGVAAVGLDFEAIYTARADRIDLEVTLTDRAGQDRALETGLVLPVTPVLFWDHPGRGRPVTQQDYSETLAYTWWGGQYNDGPWGDDRSIYPFAAVTLASGGGLAMAYDAALGPQPVRFFHSTYVGESLTAGFRLGLAPESGGLPRRGRFRLSLMRVEGTEAFRATLAAYDRLSPDSFARRVPRVGGWLTWRSPQSVPAEFDIAYHTSDGEVGADDAASILSFGYVPSYDYWLPLGDFTSAPTVAEARARLQSNATGPTSDPALQRDARSAVVSGVRDPAGDQVLEVYRASWMPGSGWSAVCAIDPDPGVADPAPRSWPARYALLKANLDTAFARARGAGTTLDGTFIDWFSSWHVTAWNHRRDHMTACDLPLSFDPATLTPAIPESYAHWESLRAIGDEMRGQGLFTMARSIGWPSFWATALLDVLSQEVNWQANPPSSDDLYFYRVAAGRKPFVVLHQADFSTFDVAGLLRTSLLLGLIPTPSWDTAAGQDYWDLPALVERDRPLFRRFMPLFRLEHQAGWEPVTGAAATPAQVLLERWGRPADGLVLFSGWNAGGEVSATVSVDLQALGVGPAEVGTVVDLIEAGRVAATVAGGRLELADQLATGAARLYHLHLRRPGEVPLVLHAVKRGDDVELRWTDAGRPFYELLDGGRRDLSGAAVELLAVPGHLAAGAVRDPAPRFFAVE